MHLPIRPARLPQDAERILEVFAAAKGIMVADGNTKQWVNGYPSLEVVQADVERNGAFVVEDGGRIVAYFAFLPSPEPTYGTIYHGRWLDDSQPYHVIHRIASVPETHGIFRTITEFAFAHDRNIRIDTHRDNRIMQHNILQHGFTYCGIILLANGDERLAYQKIIQHNRL
ncbi:MAG: N-acetyltransferase [Bacteroidales bacterium]|nr:N-acetyltransferase [Bacteroidales bacterium]